MSGDHLLYDIIAAEVTALVQDNYWYSDFVANQSSESLVIKFGVHTIDIIIDAQRPGLRVFHSHRNRSGRHNEIVLFDLTEPTSIDTFLRFLGETNDAAYKNARLQWGPKKSTNRRYLD